MDENNWNIYIHINKINNKKYVGITSKEPMKRWGKNGIHYKRQNFYKAIEKYGWDNFKHIVLYKNFTEKDAKEKEVLLIKLFKTNDKNFGYNITLGGDGCYGYKPTEETIEKLRKSHLGQVAWKRVVKMVIKILNIQKH